MKIFEELLADDDEEYSLGRAIETVITPPMHAERSVALIEPPHNAEHSALIEKMRGIKEVLAIPYLDDQDQKMLLRFWFEGPGAKYEPEVARFGREFRTLLNRDISALLIYPGAVCSDQKVGPFSFDGMMSHLFETSPDIFNFLNKELSSANNLLIEAALAYKRDYTDFRAMFQKQLLKKTLLIQHASNRGVTLSEAEKYHPPLTIPPHGTYNQVATATLANLSIFKNRTALIAEFRKEYKPDDKHVAVKKTFKK